VPPAEPAPTPCSFDEPSVDGICALGVLDFPDPEGPPVVTDPVTDVTVTGFTVIGFEGIGILFIGAEHQVVTNTKTEDNEEYGVARFFSTGGKIVGNKASGAEEAGIYVGDSPDADVLIAANEVFDNGLFGFFLRDAANGRLVGNRSHDNCVGAIVLNTGPNVAGNWRFNGNRISENNVSAPVTMRRARRRCRGSVSPSSAGPTTPCAATRSRTTCRAGRCRLRAVWSSSTSATRVPTPRRATSWSTTSSRATNPISTGMSPVRATCSAATSARRAFPTASAEPRIEIERALGGVRRAEAGA